jgi:23S rRNA pseudouridine2605 synthase
MLPHVDQRVYSVGRLDEASEGLLLMTNDGDLAHKLMHPRFQVEKTYLALVAGSPSPADLEKLLQGVWLAEGKVRARRVRRLKSQGNSTWLKVVLCEGKNREIRRMLAHQGHKVLRLKRTAIGPVELDRLPKGKCRKLSLEELKSLQKLVAEGQRKLGQLRERVKAPTPSGRFRNLPT